MKPLIAIILYLMIPVSCLAVPIKNIELSGLRRVKPKFVRRELLFKTGDEFDRSKLKASIRNLLNTHLFYDIQPKVINNGNYVDILIRFKERYSIVPIPKFRLKTNGSYRVGGEVRDYNVAGEGHHLFIMYTKWLGGQKGEDSSVRFNLYRFIREKINLGGGLSYSKSYDEDLYKNGRITSTYDLRSYRFNLFLLKYLDPYKMNRVLVGFSPSYNDYSVKSGKGMDDRFENFMNFELIHDGITDMVYFLKGVSYGIGVDMAEPISSDVFTGDVRANFSKHIDVNGVDTFNVNADVGSKFGYSGSDFLLSANVPGFENERQKGKRTFRIKADYRFNVLDKTVFVKPVVIAGDGFDRLPDHLFLTAGGELEAMWARFVDGIISFKIYRGVGVHAKTSTLLRFGFRW